MKTGFLSSNFWTEVDSPNPFPLIIVSMDLETTLIHREVSFFDRVLKMIFPCSKEGEERENSDPPCYLKKKE